MAATANFLAFTFTRLELLAEGKVIGSATGFFIRRREGWAIATNWHVLSGRDPRSGQPRHSSGAVPSICRYYVAERLDHQILWVPHELPLVNFDTGGFTWLQHPRDGQSVDIGVVPLLNPYVGVAKDLLDESGHDENMFVDLGGEVFLPGYPQGLSSGGIAIWKRGSLASSLEYGEGIDRRFYVDTATREGMSGAPCLAVSNWQHYRLDRITGKVEVIRRPLSWRLLGIYSGRLNPSDSFEAQIGVVWRERLLFEVLNSDSYADYKLS